MLIKLTNVRVVYENKTGENRQYAEAIFVNPALVQYVQPMPENTDRWEAEVKECENPKTTIGFGMDMEFQVLESLDEVLALFAGKH